MIKMCVHINNLSNDLLKYMLDFLPLKEQFVVESVCKKWQICVKEVLAKKETLERLDKYSPKFVHPFFMGMILSIDHSNIGILKSILTKCTNIKEINLHGAFVSGHGNLMVIANGCPKLERINLNYGQTDVSLEEIEEFAKKIGPQLTKCLFCKSPMTGNHIFVGLLSRRFKNLEEIAFDFDNVKLNKIIFYCLNTNCTNLKVLDWDLDSFRGNFYNQDVIDVVQRIKYLKTDLAILSTFKFETNNLNELTINQFFDDDEYDSSKLIEMTFPNVTKLNISGFKELGFDLMSKFKFPKLESVKLNNIDDINIPTSFFHQIKHIKSLIFSSSCNNSIPSIISSLDQLTNFVWKGIKLSLKKYQKLFQCFDSLSNHEAMQIIKLVFFDDEMKIGKSVFEKIITLCNAKPNTKIKIKMDKRKFEKSEEITKKFNDYKKVFDETKYLNKLTMELNLYDYSYM